MTESYDLDRLRDVIIGAIGYINRKEQRSATYDDIVSIIQANHGRRWNTQSIGRLVRKLREERKVFRYSSGRNATWFCVSFNEKCEVLKNG